MVKSLLMLRISKATFISVPERICNRKSHLPSWCWIAIALALKCDFEKHKIDGLTSCHQTFNVPMADGE